ncbi:hypothetical protein [Pseudoteredinibacter isoporae]|uniref:hypothetical protein n=1 Tax=Pseudoteredinibacter isoporae TaxID=570281 RepID=UPI003340CF3A
MKKKPWLRLLAFFLLILLSVWYMSTAFDEGLVAFRLYISELSVLSIAIALCLSLVMCQVKAEVNVELLGNSIEKNTHPAQLCLAYSLAQVVRYLPGKVLGIITQSFFLTGRASSIAIWRANVLQFLLTNANSLPVLLLVFLGFFCGDFSYFVLPVLISIAFFYLVQCNLLASFLENSPVFKKWSIKAAEIVSLKGVSAKKIWLYLNIEWLLYFSVFIFLLGFDSWQKAIALSALYSSASILAALVIIAPSGLFAREALFLWLGTLAGLEAAELLSLGVVTRVFFTLCDLLYFVSRTCISYMLKRLGYE